MSYLLMSWSCTRFKTADSTSYSSDEDIKEAIARDIVDGLVQPIALDLPEKIETVITEQTTSSSTGKRRRRRRRRGKKK